MSEWKEYKLGEIAKFISTKVSVQDVNLEDYVSTENMLVDKGGITTATNKPLNGTNTKYYPNNILISNIRPYFKKIWYANKHGGCSNDVLCFDVDVDLVNSKYFYFLLSQDLFFEYVMLGSKGCKMPRGDKSHIMNWELSLPPLSEQKRIASILSSLDDKIDLLHRENKTLEAMAETLFRKWFVEEAKEDWKEGVISDFAEHYKKSITPQKYPAELFSHYSIPAYDNNKNPANEMGNEIHSNKYVVPARCILFSKLNPHKDKRVWLILDDKQDNAICSTEFQIIYPKHSEYLYFLYGWLINKENYEEISSGVGGTSGSHQRIDPKSIFSFNCPNIDLEVIQKYNKIIEPLYIKLTINQQQIRLLTQQRDGLLPKLMSGEVKI